MADKQIMIPNDAVGQRLDQWVSKKMAITRSAFKQCVDKGCVFFMDDKIKKAGYKISSSGMLVIKDEDNGYKPIALPLDIVYEDEDLLIVNKPRHLLVYPVKDKNETTLVNGLLAYTSLSDFCGKERPGIVHRIDRDTSGLVLVAKNNTIHEKLYQQLAHHEIVREYIGIVQRPFEKRCGVINKKIAHDFAHGTKRIVTECGGQSAITHYVSVYQNDEYSLVRFRLETGRTHQIRVHMASIGHPLVGDGLYGDARNIFGFHGQALHALRLRFAHPINGKQIEVVGRPPEIFKKAVTRIQMMK
ncbi:MAG: RluA family pseudouridine synthase [Peptococcaceae bacterium]|nr:RluA family pseudouridine synthase [Peptococcaceae bacterium]